MPRRWRAIDDLNRQLSGPIGLATFRHYSPPINSIQFAVALAVPRRISVARISDDRHQEIARWIDRLPERPARAAIETS
jgi:glutathione S-transferase